MPTFEEQYKELFGVDLNYDPIDINADDQERPNPRLNLVSGNLPGPDATPELDDFESRLNALNQEITRTGPPADEPGLFGDIGRTLGAGTVETGGMLIGAAEYAARQLGDDSNFGQYLINQAVEPLSDARRATMKYSEDILAGMSQDSQDQIRRQWLTLDPEQTIWQGGPSEFLQSVGLKFSRALPATVLTLAPAARFFRAGMTPGALTYLAASEGGLSLGGIANGIADEVESLDTETLRKESPFYADLISQGMNEEEARDELIKRAQGAAPLIGGVMVGAISAIAGRYLEPVFARGAGLRGRVVRGGLAESPQESLQSGAEQFMQNVAAQVFDNDRPLTEGVGEAMVEGGTLGFLTGGAFAGVLGARPSRPPPERTADDEAGGPPEPEPEPTALSGAVVPSVAPGQQEFQFTRRERGYRGVPLPGRELLPEAVDYSLDVTQPPGVAADPRQGDLFVEQPLGQFDITGPSAEPLADLDAQFREMARPEAEREGVYLSAKTVANLEQQGALEDYLKPGISIANFSEQGDVLVVRDREIADRVLEEKNTGRDLDRTLGEVTGAGLGRPAEGDTVVQRRDETGSVVQERLAANEAEAEQIAAEWEKQYPQFDVLVMTAPASIRRRNTRIAQELRAREEAQVAAREERVAQVQRQKAQERVRRAGRQLPEDIREEAAAAPTPERAAARLLGAAAREAGPGEQQRIGGFLPTNQLEFADEREEIRYRNRFDKLVDQELIIQMTPDRALKKAAKKERARLLDELAEIRGRAKPKRKALKIVRAAARVSPKTTRAAIREARKRGTKKPRDLPEAPLVEEEPLRNLTDEQIDKLSGDKLSGVFEQAANWLAGRYRALTLAYEGQEAPSAETLPEGAELLAISTPKEREIQPPIELESAKREKGWSVFTLRQGEEVTTVKRRGTIKAEKPKILKDIEARNRAIKRSNAVGMKEGLTMEDLADKFRTTAAQRKLIRRVRNQLLKREYGGGVKTKPLAKSAVRSKVKKDRVIRRGKFDPTVLGPEKLPKDESKVDRRKRVNAAKKARDKLDRTLRRTVKYSDRLNTGEFAELRQERVDGELTDAARGMIYAKAYFRYLADYATALSRSKNKSSAMIEEMEQVEKLLADITRMNAQDFSRVVGNLMLAESQAQLKESTKAFSDEVRDKLADPEQREAANAKIRRRLMADTARIARLENMWKTNSYYNTVVAPLLHNFHESITRDGYPSYKPSEEELTQLQWVLDGWKIPRLRKDMYTPIRRMLTSLGFEWTKDGQLIIPRDAEGNYSYEVADRALLPLYKSRFGTEIEDAGIVLARRENYSGPKLTPAEVQQRQEDAALIAVRVDEKADIEQFGRLAQANRIIESFREFIAKPKTTVAGFIRAEQRLIRAFKELGLWRDTPTPNMGRIMLRTPRTYRMVGPRLEAKKIKKEEARKLLLKGIRTQPLPKKWAEKPSVQAKAQEELAAERELFMKVTEPGPSIEQFQDVGNSIQERLNNIETHASMQELLQIIVRGLPPDHMYAKLATQIHDMKMDDIPVSWDWRGQLKGVMGGARWEADNTMPNGTFRYILLNKEKINRFKDPSYGLLHTLLHEATHMATAGAVDNNQAVRDAVITLRKIVREEFKRVALPGAEMPYGLRELNPNEFVAEAFANPTFQSLLKRVKFNRELTGWARFVNIVKNILGVDTAQPREPANAYEAIMDLTHPLFTGEMRDAPAATLELDIDPALRPYVDDIGGVMQDRMEDLRRGWQRAAKRGLRAPLALMSMRQLHKEFRRHFGGVGNPLDRYKEAWERRDAENSRLMKIGEDLSRIWTGLTESTSTADALEFSRLATESSLYKIHPDRPIDHATNEHLKSDEQIAKHAELSQRFRSMPARWQALWKKVQKYYINALEKEIDLVTLNALRGVLASGRNPTMLRAEFDKRYTAESVRELKLNTKEGLMKEFPDMPAEQIATLMEIVSIPTKREGPYFPLTRYGNYVVYAKRTAETKKFDTSKEAFAYRASKLAADPTLEGSVREVGDKYEVVVEEKDFRTAESPSEAEQMREEMIEQYGAENVTDVQLKDKFKTEETIRSGSALNRILGELDGNPKAQNAIKDWWLRSLADSSFRKHEIRRKNRRGVNYDLQHRNFTNYVKKTSYYRSQLKYGWQMADAMTDLRKFVREYQQENANDPLNIRLGELRNHLIRRDKLTDDIEETSKAIRRGTEIGQLYMLFGPSYWMINSTQPYMVTLPWLGARYGWGASLAALRNSQSLIIHPLLKATKESLGGLKALTSKEAAEKAFNVLDQVKKTIRDRGGERADDYIDMLEKLREHSIIDLSWVAELRDIAEGRDTSAWQKTMDATRVMGHLTEVNNRILSALAAYDLRYQEIIGRQGATHSLAHAEAIEFAKQATSETHFDYSAGNKPLLFQPKGPLGQFAPLVFQFLQWPQHMYAMMISNIVASVGRGAVDKMTARKTIAGLLATHAVAGGIIGMTLQPLKWALGMALWALSDEEDPETLKTVVSGETFDRWVRKQTSEMFGPGLGKALSAGIPAAALGTDLSDRMSLGTVYFIDLKTDTAESTLGSIAAGFGGPWINLMLGASKGIGMAMEGDFQRGVEYVLPKAAKDAMRAIRFAQDGLVNNAGDTVLPSDGLSPYQLFLQTLGFRPSEISDFYSRQSLIKDTERYGIQRRGSLLKRFRTADSIEERNRVLEEIKEFNAAWPAARITRSALIRAIREKGRREASYRTYGANLRGRAIIYGEKGQYYQ